VSRPIELLRRRFSVQRRLSHFAQKVVYLRPRKTNAPKAQSDEMCAKTGSTQQTEFVKSAKNPDRSVILQGEVPGEFAAPLVIHYHRRASLRSLHHRFRFASITVGATARQKHSDGRLIVAVTRSDEGEGSEKTSDAILRNPPFEQVFSYRLGKQYFRKEEGELWKKLEMVESDDTRTVDNTGGPAHQSLLMEPRSTSPAVSSPRARSAFFELCWACIPFRCSTIARSAAPGP
jgi:hypothetical protein